MYHPKQNESRFRDLKQSLSQRLHEFHYREPNWLSRLLSPLTLPYKMAVDARHWAYEKGLLHKDSVPVPVISVGNLTTGGTGKTPVVMALAEDLMLSGYKVLILNRGYGASKPVQYGRALHPKFGDEGFLLQKSLPGAIVIVGKDRAANARKAIAEFDPDVIILDDGFQYVKLERSLNILLVDADKLFGNQSLLPVGPLREPLEQIQRADLIWVTKGSNDQSTNHSILRVRTVVHKHAKGKRIPVFPLPFNVQGFAHDDYTDLIPMDAFRGESCIAFSGIAQPGAFARDLRSTGVKIVKHFRFDDHRNYTPMDIARVLNARPSDQTMIVTTDKDWVKAKSLVPERIRPFVYTLKVRPILTDFYEIFSSLGLSNPYASPVIDTPSTPQIITHPGGTSSFYR